MAILLHVLIALTSLAYTAYVFFTPSRAKLRASYTLVAATILSGTYLVVTLGAHMLEACIMGLFYLSVVTVGIVGAQRKLAADQHAG